MITRITEMSAMSFSDLVRLEWSVRAELLKRPESWGISVGIIALCGVLAFIFYKIANR